MIYSLLFFLSGFAGLLYQIVWVRMAFTHFGIISPVLSVVVSVFMLGLGLGAWAAGRWTEVRSGGRPRGWLRNYGLVEFGIGLWALGVPAFYRVGESGLLSGGEMNSWVYLLGAALAILVTLLPGCTLMGMTYPLMMAHWNQYERDSKTSFSYLYRANVIGALAGAILTPLVLIECLGFQRSTWIGVFCNFLAAALSLIMARRLRETSLLPDPLKAASPVTGPALSSRFVLGMLALTGFVSMAFEVCWTRMFTPVLGTTIYAFSAILAVYLTSTAFGVTWYRRDLRQSRVQSPGWMVGWLGLCAFLPILLNDPRLGGKGFAAIGSLIPFCTLLGYLTPFFVDRYAGGDSRRAGLAYAVNIAGCVLGPLAASYWVLPFAGPRIGIVILSLPFLCAMLSAELNVGTWRRFRFGVGGVGVLFTGTAIGLLGTPGETFIGAENIVIRRDYAATVVSLGTGFKRQLLVNGMDITVLTPVTKVMAYLPFLAHSNHPQSALMICFGMGTTYRSLLSLGLDTTAVELIPSVRDAFGFYFEDAQSVRLNPRGRIVIDDGRRFLKRGTTLYDIVTLDPPPPVEAAGSGLLYSKEFYEDVKKRLKPDGILQQWWPVGELKILRSLARSLQESFPYVRVYKGVGGIGFHFLASRQPIRQPTLEEMRQRLSPEARRDIQEWAPGYPLDVLIRPFFGHEVPLTRLVDPSIPALTDDRPFNEYYLLRRWKDERLHKDVQAL